MCSGLVRDVKHAKCMCKGNHGGGATPVSLSTVMQVNMCEISVWARGDRPSSLSKKGGIKFDDNEIRNADAGEKTKDRQTVNPTKPYTKRNTPKERQV